MKNLILLTIIFAFAASVQAQTIKPVLKAEDKKTEKVSETTAPDEPVEVRENDDIEIEKVEEAEKPRKKPVAVPKEKPAGENETVKPRGDSEKPIDERGKGKPERVREMQKEKFDDKKAEKEHKKKHKQLKKDEKGKSKASGKEKKKNK